MSTFDPYNKPSSLEPYGVAEPRPATGCPHPGERTGDLVGDYTPDVLRLYTPAWECKICKSTIDLEMRFISDTARSTRCASCWQRAEDETALVLLIKRVQRNPVLADELRRVLGVK